MSWFLRKSVSFGPLRINFSKSGVGASVGVKGARVSVGPKGTHLYAGRGGIYFRERIGGRKTRPSSPNAPPAPKPEDTYQGLHEIRTAGASLLVDPTSENLLRELRSRHRKITCAPAVGVIGAISTVAAAIAADGSVLLWILAVVLAILTAIFTIKLHQRDIERKTVNLEIDLDDESRIRVEQFSQAMNQLAECRRVWRLISHRGTDDWKRNAGASRLVSRNPVAVCRRLPPYVVSNFVPHSILTRKQTLYFMPDRILVYEGRNIGSVSYGQLEVLADTTRFIEEDGVPRDAKVVDTTWRYVNKSGGPDRRFNDNRELPVCLYGELIFRSKTGMHFEFQISRSVIPAVLRNALHDMRDLHVCPEEPNPQPRSTSTPSASDHTTRPSTPTIINVACPSCSTQHRIKSIHAGRIALCKQCGSRMPIPAAKVRPFTSI